MSDGNKILSQNIRYARTQTGLTQQQSADLIGITAMHYGRLERGERKTSLDQIEKIAEVFGVSPYDLLDGCFRPASIPSFQSENDEIYFGQLQAMLKRCTPEIRALCFDICQRIVRGDS